MFVILKRTLQETLRLWTVLLTLAAGVAGGYIIGTVGASYNTTIYDNLLDRMLMMQHLVVFFLTYGVILMGVISAIGAGLIAGEVHEGTLRILAAKPNSRMGILLGKVLGLITGTILLMVMGLAALLASETFFGTFDINIWRGMMAYVPAYLLYGAIVMLFFSSLATLLSCLAKKRLVAMLPMLLLMILVLGLPVIIRVVSMGMGRGGASGILAYADLNYHFGCIYKWCLDFCGGIHGNSGILELPTMLLNIFKQFTVDKDITRTQNYNVLTVENDLLRPLTVVTVYAGLTLFNYITSFLVMRRKDV